MAAMPRPRARLGPRPRGLPAAAVADDAELAGLETPRVAASREFLPLTLFSGTSEPFRRFSVGRRRRHPS